jgi:S1-C subfamily serine protease
LKCELQIVSGARAGHHEVFDKGYLGLGRHPLSDLRFDAEKDLDASTRHAAIVKTGDTFTLKDLGSTNGTFVNGEKLTGERQLHDGDRLKFGVHGPEVTFHLVREEHDAIIEAVHQPPAPKPTAQEPAMTAGRGAAPATKAPAPKTPPPPSRTAVLRAEIGEQRSRYRVLAAVLVIVIAGALGIVYWMGRTANVQIQSLTTRLDSLREIQRQADSTRAALEAQLRSEADPAKQHQIQDRIRVVTVRATAAQSAQGVDYNAILAANVRAIAVVSVRFASDTTRIEQGTAFALNTSGLMITNKHVVSNGTAETPRDIAIQFHGSTEVLPARLVKVSPDADLAIIQLESAGPFPAISGLADAGQPEGSPIALIGFPGGWDRFTEAPHAKLVNGYISRFVADSLIELDAFSGQGASGSPIFDKDGKVIGVEFGGLQGSGGRAIVGLPVSRLQALLR